jgi:hypothetical protein
VMRMILFHVRRGKRSCALTFILERDRGIPVKHLGEVN